MTEVLSNGHANGAREEQAYGEDKSTPQLAPIRLPMVDESTATDYNSMNGEFVSPMQARSPRFEAFVMTGDKMINLKSKISPCYAKVGTTITTRIMCIKFGKTINLSWVSIVS